VTLDVRAPAHLHQVLDTMSFYPLFVQRQKQVVEIQLVEKPEGPHMRRLTVVLFLCLITNISVKAASQQENGYWAPTSPPRAYYKIDSRVDPSSGTLHGVETISFVNNSAKHVRRLALAWVPAGGPSIHITVNGNRAKILTEFAESVPSLPIVFELYKAAAPGERIEIHVKFSQNLMAAPKSVREETSGAQDWIVLTKWHPRLHWGYAAHDDFDVKLQAPSDYTIASSGRVDPKSGYFHAEAVREFGLFLGRLQVMEAYAGDVLVRCLFTPRGRDTAKVLLDTAVESINFYRKFFGFYPYTTLSIVPGIDAPVGGYPIATSLVAVHGQERFAERPAIHWQWIAAHEIGHMYWGEYVLDKSGSLGWLSIGLGIFTDREYVIARGLSLEKHQELMARYTEAVRDNLDTTVDITPDKINEMEMDFNTVVTHGKGYSIISALAFLLGKETFTKILRRCLREFAGRRLSAESFQAISEAESKQDLQWFFDQWLRSNRFLASEIISQSTAKSGDRYLSTVRIKSVGTLRMPVPVEAYFQDGSSQTQLTERLLENDVLTFDSVAPLDRVLLDPNHVLPLVRPLPPPLPVTETNLTERIRALPWTNPGESAVTLFNKAKELKLSDAGNWAVLGLKLYDGKYYEEALQAFRRAAELAKRGTSWEFGALVWQGHILDLLGRREEGLQAYKSAIEKDKGQTLNHGQYRMTVNRGWVEKRLIKPFQR
jgi:tetratricopeptide (TPR) repeat protein